MAAQYNVSSSDTLQNPVKQNTKYLRGTASTPNRSLAGEMPEHFKNKVIVISPISKEIRGFVLDILKTITFFFGQKS